MASRLQLHEELCEILGSRNVYFNPPEDLKMKYPCIVYSRSGLDKQNANNRLYKSTNQYQVVVIDLDPDGTIHMKLVEHYPMCRFDRWYVSNNLTHNALILYY